MKFASPDMLLFLAVIVPALIVFFWWARKKRNVLISQFVQSRLLASLTVGVSARRQLWKNSLLTAGIALILIALARPHWDFDWEETRQQGLDIVVAVDTSRSMLATDVAPDRLTRTKLAIRDLLLATKSDRMGLVAFAGTAFLQCPLTVDREAFQQSVNILDVDIIPEGGSDVGGAIEAALNAFEKSEGTHRAIVIFTDGEDHVNRAIEAAEKAGSEGVHLFTIGVGTPGGELLKYTDPRGQTVYLRDAEGNPINSRLNESLLQQIAGTANGFYLPLSSADSMNALYERGLAPLPRGETASRMVKNPVERYQWPLGLGIILVIAELFVSDRRRPQKGATKPETPFWQAAIVFLFAGNSLMAASASTARDHYDRNEFNEAYQEYRSLQEERPEDPRLKFNAGAAAYESGRFGEAIQQFKESLRTTELDLQQQGYYNVGNSMYRQGTSELQADPNNMDVAISLWTEAVNNFKSAIQLNPQDQKAAHNKAFVEKKLVELKKKRAESGNQSSKSGQQDQNKGNDGNQQNQQGKGENEGNQGNPRPGQDPQQQQGNGEQDQQQGRQPGGEQQQQQAQNQGDEQEKGPGDPNDQVAYFGKMTAEQARQLLDAQRGEEKAMLFLPKNRTNRVNDPRKNW